MKKVDEEQTLEWNSVGMVLLFAMSNFIYCSYQYTVMLTDKFTQTRETFVSSTTSNTSATLQCIQRCLRNQVSLYG